MTKAFGYLRVSGQAQVKGDGFPRQLAAIKSYAAANDIKIQRVFEEKGVSGALDSMDRLAWVEMMGLVLANGVKTIVIEKLDRLARDLMVQEHIIADLQRYGVNLISAAEPDLCSNDPGRKLMRHIMGAIAEYDKTMIVAKLKVARQRKKAGPTGRCEGQKPFGHYVGENAALSRMRELHKSETNLTAIASTLNSEGIKPRQGTKWFPMTVSRILKRKVQINGEL